MSSIKFASLTKPIEKNVGDAARKALAACCWTAGHGRRQHVRPSDVRAPLHPPFGDWEQNMYETPHIRPESPVSRSPSGRVALVWRGDPGAATPTPSTT